MRVGCSCQWWYISSRMGQAFLMVMATLRAQILSQQILFCAVDEHVTHMRSYSCRPCQQTGYVGACVTPPPSNRVIVSFRSPRRLLRCICLLAPHAWKLYSSCSLCPSAQLPSGCCSSCVSASCCAGVVLVLGGLCPGVASWRAPSPSAPYWLYCH